MASAAAQAVIRIPSVFTEHPTQKPRLNGELNIPTRRTFYDWKAIVKVY
jgi:hypothetical protein